MALTPADVHNQQFTTVRMRTGYDMDEVDAFLDTVEAELARLLAENDDLRAQVTQAQSRALAAEQRATKAAPATPATPAPVPPAPATPANPELAKVVEQASAPPAEKPADNPADKPAEAAVEKLEDKPVDKTAVAAVVVDGPAPSEQALKILEIAQRTADETVAHAKSEASTILTKARTQAAEVTANLDAQRIALEKQVGQLRTFERNYRVALRDHIAGQLAEFDRAASTDDSVVGPTPAIESVQAAIDD